MKKNTKQLNKPDKIKGVTTYTKTTLVGNEKIIFAAKLHFFSYVIPGILAILGAFLLFAPEVHETILDEQEEVDSVVGSIQSYIKNRINDVTALVPEAVKPFVGMVSDARKYFLGMLFFGFGVGGVVNSFIKKRTLEFVVTDKKVVFKKGFVQRDATELNLERIESVKVFQTAFDRMLGKGRVFIMGIGMEQINLKNIAEPIKFHHIILESMSNYSTQSTQNNNQ